MSTNAKYASTPRYESAVVSSANANYDGTGTIVTLFTAGANGSRVDTIGWGCAGTSLAGLLNFFWRKTSSDTWRYFISAPIPAITASATANPNFGAQQNLNVVLSAGAQIGVATSVANTINVHVALAGDF